MKKMIFACLVGALLQGVLGCAKPSEQAGQAAPPPALPEGLEEPQVWKFTYGPEEAKVVVEAFYPLTEAHQWAKEVVEKVCQEHPGKVRGVVVDFRHEKGSELFVQKGLTCGTILINGEDTFDLEGRTVIFQQAEGGMWTEEDLRRVVAQKVEEAYGATEGEEGTSAETSAAAPSAQTPSQPKTSPPTAPPRLAVGPARPEVKGEVEVYVPCGVAGPYGEVAEAFKAQYPNVRLRPRVENFYVLRNRVRDGATPDVFLVFGPVDLKPLEERGRLVSATYVKLAKISLALIVPPSNPGQVKSLEDLAGPAVKQIALGKVDLGSVGYCAQQALTRAQLWDKVKDKVVEIKMPRQLKVVAAEGQVEAAIVFKSCLYEAPRPGKEPEPLKATYIGDVPAHLYDEIEVGAVMIKGAPHPEMARLLLDFLDSPEVRATFVKWWFTPLEEE